MSPHSPRRRSLPDNVTVALGAVASRLTGFTRIIIFGWVLIPIPGDGRLADVYTLANTMPNIVYDLVLGGVLAATLVPRFTRAVAEDDHDAIDAIVSVCLVALAALTVVATFAAPLIIRTYTAIGSAAVAHEYNAVATLLAYFFLPQIFFYGANSVLSALLNARGKFFAAAWVPVLTNVVMIAGLILVKLTFNDITIDTARASSKLRMELGLGATLGVAAMALALVPAVRHAGIPLKFNFNIHHPAIREVLRLSTWTLGYVLTNQFTFLIISGLALRHFSDYSAYTNMYLLFQVPHGLLAVTIMTTHTPKLTRARLAHDDVLFRSLVRSGLRTIVGLLLPAAVLLAFASRPASAMGGNVSTLAAAANILRAFGFALIPFSIYLFLLRGFYAMSDTRSTFVMNLAQNAANIVFAVALSVKWGGAGLAWGFTLSYCGAAVFAWVRLNEKVRGGLRSELLVPGLLRALVAAVPMSIAVWAITGAMDRNTGVGAVMTLGVSTIIGGGCYGATLIALGGMAPSRHGTPRRR